MAVKQTRTLTIKDRVFTKADITKLGNVVQSEYDTLEKTPYSQSLLVKIECSDDSRHEGDNVSLFQDDDILETRHVDKISMGFTSREPRAEIHVILTEGSSNGYVIVAGDDHNWVSGVYTRLENIIKATKPQGIWITKHRTISQYLTLASGLALLALIFHSTGYALDSLDSNIVFYFFYIVYGFIGFFVLHEIEKAWPSIEFAFGPAHWREAETQRKWTLAVFSGLIFPLFPAAIYDLIRTMVT